jgi:type II secretory pathway component PulL
MILMFVPLIRLQQEISEASDDASKKYYEITPEKDRTGSGVTKVMRAAAKSKHQSFKGQFSKFTTVANPKFGDAFIDEVSLLCFCASQFLLKYC